MAKKKKKKKRSYFSAETFLLFGIYYVTAPSEEMTKSWSIDSVLGRWEEDCWVDNVVPACLDEESL